MRMETEKENRTGVCFGVEEGGRGKVVDAGEGCRTRALRMIFRGEGQGEMKSASASGGGRYRVGGKMGYLDLRTEKKT